MGRFFISTPFLAVLAIVTVVVVLFVAVKSSQGLATSKALKDSNERFDCKTQYNALLGDKVKARDNFTAEVSALSASLNAQFGAALLDAQATGHRSTPDEVASFRATKAELDAKSERLDGAIAVVRKLPNLDQAADHGFSLDGKSYPPCPKVG